MRRDAPTAARGAFQRTLQYCAADQTLTQVTRITPRRGPPVPVYNLEVDAEHVYFVGENGVLVHNAYSSTSGETAATILGRLAHVSYNPGSTYTKNFLLESGRRADAVDVANRIVRELKPNNPRAIRRGEIQVKRYLEELESMFGGTWTSHVDTY